LDKTLAEEIKKSQEVLDALKKRINMNLER